MPKLRVRAWLDVSPPAAYPELPVVDQLAGLGDCPLVDQVLGHGLSLPKAIELRSVQARRRPKMKSLGQASSTWRSQSTLPSGRSPAFWYSRSISRESSMFRLFMLRAPKRSVARKAVSARSIDRSSGL
jgi:hypothetical protein